MNKSELITSLKGARANAPEVTITRTRYGYKLDGQNYRRVTTLLNGIPKPQLVPWAAKSVAEYAVEHKDEWSGLPKADAIKLLKQSPYSKRDAAGDRGSAIHAALEAVVKDTALPEGLTEDEDACAAAAMGFLGELGGTFLATELIVLNATLGQGYAGTLTSGTSPMTGPHLSSTGSRLKPCTRATECSRLRMPTLRTACLMPSRSSARKTATVAR